MSEPVKVIVEIEGGCIQNVISCGIEVQVIVVDYDVQDPPAAEGEPGPFVTTNGDTAELDIFDAAMPRSDEGRSYVADILERVGQEERWEEEANINAIATRR